MISGGSFLSCTKQAWLCCSHIAFARNAYSVYIYIYVNIIHKHQDVPGELCALTPLNSLKNTVDFLSPFQFQSTERLRWGKRLEVGLVFCKS